MTHAVPWHERWSVLRVARRSMRRRFFDVFRAAVSTDEGRRILTESLRNQLRWRPALPLRAAGGEAFPYPEVGGRAPAPPASAPVFITARFRTGSTALWNAFRQVRACTAFYEPLNERRWFSPLRRGVHIDPTHRTVPEYWREYDGMDDLDEIYRDEWTSRDLYMDDSAWNPGLRSYIDALIARAPGRPVLQFNEIDFRLPWLRAHFPSACIIHLYRHPRDQWCSSLLGLQSFPFDAPRSAFPANDHFYLQRWVTDLKYTFPFLADEVLRHPYEQFYAIWRLSYLFGRSLADRSICYEHLIESPQSQLAALFDWLQLPLADLAAASGVIRGGDHGRWREYAPPEWFAAREAAAGQRIDEFFGLTAGGPAYASSEPCPA